MNPERDSVYDVWLELFTYCASRYQAVFVIICAREEIDPRFRYLDNVLIAKDHGTSLEQDLALVDGSAMHMGASSGPGTVAMFGPKPYCIFNLVLDLSTIEDFVVEEDRVRFFFSTPYQAWLMKRETTPLAIAEFERLWPVALRGPAEGAQHGA
jgi:hypothetical protein